MSKYKEKLKIALPILAAVVIIAALLIFGKNITLEKILGYTPDNLTLAALLLLALYTVCGIFVVFPMKLLYAAGGVLFPLPLSLIINTVGVALEITVPYWTGRFGGQKLVEKTVKKYPKLRHITALRSKNDVALSILARMTWVLSPDIISIYFGATAMPYGPYLLGGTIGFLPSMIIITLLGDSAQNPGSTQFILCAVLYVLVAAGAGAAFYFTGIKSQKQNSAESSPVSETEQLCQKP